MDPKQTVEDTDSPSFWESYRPPIPDTSHLITETDEPVDNLFSEKQMRLLTEPLYVSWKPGRRFWVAANIGMYEALNAQAVVPDVLLSLDTGPDQAKEFGSKCYFFWDHGKPPDVVVEIVSNKRGGELDTKKERYAKLKVDHYLVFDPDEQLSGETLQAFVLVSGSFEKRPPSDVYQTVEGLGLRLWEGEYEGHAERWLRWCDESGVLIATGAERVETEVKRVETEVKRVETEAKRAEAAARRAEAEAAKAAAYAERLRELGIDPDSL